MKITHLGNGRFEMESMTGQKMTVNQNELSQLALIAKDYADQLRQNAAGKVAAMSTVRVTSCTVGIDMHRTEVILRLREIKGGSGQAYCLPHDLAKGMIVGLTNQVNLIEEEAAKRGRSQ
jgi:hypothetical protein